VYVGIFNTFDTRVAAPDDPVTVSEVIRFVNAEEKFVKSEALKAPLLVALAVGTFKVITGVVVLLATVLVKSVPVVPKVKAETEVTVPLVDDVPAPIAVRKSAAFDCVIVPSVLICKNDVVVGVPNVKKLLPKVVAPNEVLPVAATKLVALPSHCNVLE